MSDWVPIQKYAPRPRWVVTLHCGHAGVLDRLPYDIWMSCSWCSSNVAVSSIWRVAR